MPGRKISRRRNRQIQNRGFNAHLRLAAVHDQRNFAAELRADVLRIGRRNPAGQIRARRGQRKTAFADHRLNERMARPADADRLAARRDDVGNFFRARQNQRQRSGPESFRKFFRAAPANSFTQRFAISMPATWTMMGLCRRPAFDLENFGDGLFVQRIGGEPINRFRRQRDDFAGAQQFRRARTAFEKAPACAWKNFSRRRHRDR